MQSIEKILKNIKEENSFEPPKDLRHLEALIKYMKTNENYREEVEVYLSQLLKMPCKLKDVEGVEFLCNTLKTSDINYAILISNIASNKDNLFSLDKVFKLDLEKEAFVINDRKLNREEFVEFIINYSKYQKLPENIYYAIHEEKIKINFRQKSEILLNQIKGGFIEENSSFKTICNVLKEEKFQYDTLLHEKLTQIIFQNENFVKNLEKLLEGEIFSNEIFFINLLIVFIIQESKTTQQYFKTENLVKFLFYNFSTDKSTEKIRESAIFLSSLILPKEKKKKLIFFFWSLIFIFDNSKSVKISIFRLNKKLENFRNFTTKFFKIKEFQELTNKNKQTNKILQAKEFFQIDKNFVKEYLKCKCLSSNLNTQNISIELIKKYFSDVKIKKFQQKYFFKISDVFENFNANFKFESNKLITNGLIFYLKMEIKIGKIEFDNEIRKMPNFDVFIEIFFDSLKTENLVDLTVENFNFLIKNKLISADNFDRKFLKENVFNLKEEILKMKFVFRNNFSFHLICLNFNFEAAEILKVLEKNSKISVLGNKIEGMKFIKGVLKTTIKETTIIKTENEKSLISTLINNFIIKGTYCYETTQKGDESWELRKLSFECLFLISEDDCFFSELLMKTLLRLLCDRSKYLRDFLCANFQVYFNFIGKLKNSNLKLFFFDFNKLICDDINKINFEEFFSGDFFEVGISPVFHCLNILDEGNKIPVIFSVIMALQNCSQDIFEFYIENLKSFREFYDVEKIKLLIEKDECFQNVEINKLVYFLIEVNSQLKLFEIKQLECFEGKLTDERVIKTLKLLKQSYID